MRLSWKVGVWLMILFGPAAAQEQPLSFERAFELAVERTPVRPATQASREAAHRMVEQAGAGPNPYVQFQLQTDALDRVNQVGLSVGQKFELGGKKLARVDAARAAAAQADLHGWLRLVELRLATRERFLTLLSAQRREAVAQTLVDLTEKHLSIARGRLNSGDIAGVEHQALVGELERRRARLLVQAGERREAAVALAEYVWPDHPADFDLRVEGELGWHQSLPDAETLWAVSGQQNLTLRLAQAAVEAQTAQYRLEQANGVSDLTVQLGIFSQRDVFEAEAFRPTGRITRLDDSSAMLGLQLQIPLTLNDDNSGNIAAAKARQRQAEAEKTLILNQVRARLFGLREKLAAQQAARLALEASAAPASQKVLDTTETAYRLGYRNLVELLLARESYLSIQEDLIGAAYQESLTLARLEALLGRPLEGVVNP